MGYSKIIKEARIRFFHSVSKVQFKEKTDINYTNSQITELNFEKAPVKSFSLGND